MAEEGAEGHIAQAGISGAALAGALGAAVNSARVDELVERQIALANLQIEDMENDNAVRSRTLRLVEFSALMKVAFEIAAALVITVIALVLVAAVWSASHAQGLIIEAFQVPSALSEQGLTGQVVAARIQDKLADLQAKTDSIRAPSSFQNNWGNDIKVQIPDTGVSIGEFNRYLHVLLGHETHITGEIWRTADGISVVARAGMESGSVFSGKESELDALLQKAAESVYEKTQPYRYAVYLGEQNKTAQSLAVLQKLAATAPRSEQAWAYLDWALTEFFYTQEWRKGRELIDVARERDPGNADVYNTMSSLDGNLDREEGQLNEARTAISLFDVGRADFNPGQAKTSTLLLKVNAAELVGDFHTALDLDAQVLRRSDFGGSVFGALVDITSNERGLHDVRAAAAASQRMRDAAKQPFEILQYLAVSIQAGVGIDDWQGMIRDHAAFMTTVGKAPPDVAAGVRIFEERPVTALYALALARTGDFAGAEAAIRRVPADCDACLRAHGDIAATQKQWARAGWWFAHAVMHAPSIPQGYVDWGQMLLAKGDADDALAKFKTATLKGPRFADGFEGEGEALIARNRSDLALAKFEEAAKYAPNWKRLHQKWGEALYYLGRKDEAAKQFAIARSLDG